MIKAVVFDSDGTLFNSFELIMAADVHIALTHGFRPPTADEVKPLLARALPITEIYRALFPGADVEKLAATGGEFVAANVSKAAAFDGLHDMLQALRELGLRLAIVTGGNSKIYDLLKHHGIGEYFTSVVHNDRVTNGKPHPEGVELALSELGVSTKETVMVGDSKNDLLAGKNAGLAYCIGITHGHGSAEELEAAGADYIVGSLTELLPLLKTLNAGVPHAVYRR